MHLFYIYLLLFNFNNLVKSDSSPNDQFLVYFFLMEDCKICQNYVSEMNDLKDEFESDSIHFTAFFSNPSSSQSKINLFNQKYNFKINSHFDESQTTASSFKITVTPECLVYNLTKKKVLYQGRISDWYATIGKKRSKINQHDLRNALLSIQSGHIPLVQRTLAVGCLLTYN